MATAADIPKWQRKTAGGILTLMVAGAMSYMVTWGIDWHRWASVTIQSVQEEQVRRGPNIKLVEELNVTLREIQVQQRVNTRALRMLATNQEKIRDMITALLRANPAAYTMYEQQLIGEKTDGLGFLESAKEQRLSP